MILVMLFDVYCCNIIFNCFCFLFSKFLILYAKLKKVFIVLCTHFMLGRDTPIASHFYVKCRSVDAEKVN